MALRIIITAALLVGCGEVAEPPPCGEHGKRIWRCVKEPPSKPEKKTPGASSDADETYMIGSTQCLRGIDGAA